MRTLLLMLFVCLGIGGAFAQDSTNAEELTLPESLLETPEKEKVQEEVFKQPEQKQEQPKVSVEKPVVVPKPASKKGTPPVVKPVQPEVKPVAKPEPKPRRVIRRAKARGSLTEDQVEALRVKGERLAGLLDSTTVVIEDSTTSEVDTIQVAQSSSADSVSSSVLLSSSEGRGDLEGEAGEDTTETLLPAALNVLNVPGVLEPKKAEESEKKNQWDFFTWFKVIESIFMLFATWIFVHLVSKVFLISSERWPRHRLTLKGILPLFRVLSWTGALCFIAFVILRPPVETIFAFFASAGIAIGFASQDILKNTFAGFIILFDKPFKVGDKIEVNGFYGEVISVGLRSVRIHTAGDSIIAIPNTEIINKAVSNANSGEPDCLVEIPFWFPVTIDIDQAGSLGKNCIALSRYTFLNKKYTVVFQNAIEDREVFIKMTLKVYVIDHRFENALKSDLTEIVLREFRKRSLI